MYEELYEIWRNELKKAELEDLPRDFYAKVADYLKRLKEETRMMDKKAMRTKLLFIEEQNVKRMIREIIQARRKKIIGKTITGGKISPSFLSGEEQNIYGKVLQFSENFQEFMKQFLEGRKPTTTSEYASKMVVLKFLKDVPAIVGQDMKVYGPFKVEDVASLPSENAKILIRQGLAERINVG
jgi:DNA replication factor GINS